MKVKKAVSGGGPVAPTTFFASCAHRTYHRGLSVVSEGFRV